MWISVTAVYYTMEIISRVHLGLQRRDSLEQAERQVTVAVCAVRTPVILNRLAVQTWGK